MAVYTDVSDEALRAHLSAYDLGSLVSFKGIAEGVENSNYLLVTTRGSWILTLYEKRVAAEDLPFFVGLMDHLAARGFRCPQPVRDRAGETVRELCGRPSCIVTFLDGTWSREPTEGRLEQVGAAAARMHLLAADFGVRRVNALDMNGWQPLIDAIDGRAGAVEPGLDALIRDEMAFQRKNQPADLPRGVVHADLFPDNVFFLDDTFSGVIDFYFGCNDALAWEIAILLNAWCFDRERDFNAAKAAAILRGYEGERVLSIAERDALPVLCRGAALRFLLTRTLDWLDVPRDALVRPHDPKPFARRLRHWRSE